MGLAPLAAQFGRVPLDCRDSGLGYAAQNLIYCITNRHYVSPRMKAAVEAMAAALKDVQPGPTLFYLDAGFPMPDGVPLLPHLSHDSGRELDLAFYYLDETHGGPSPETRSPFGYWAFEQPRAGDPRPCGERRERWSMRWDFDWLQPLWPDRPLDETATRRMLDWLATEGPKHGLTRMFLEPHLVARLGLRSDRIRFQGCYAARHDDHVHIEVR